MGKGFIYMYKDHLRIVNLIMGPEENCISLIWTVQCPGRILLEGNLIREVQLLNIH